MVFFHCIVAIILLYISTNTSEAAGNFHTVVIERPTAGVQCAVLLNGLNSPVGISCWKN